MAEQKSAIASVSVKNKRLKMSPGGLLALPVSARKALGMAKGSGARVTIRVENGLVVVVTAQGTTDSTRVSPKGIVELPDDAKKLIASAKTRHYWIEAFDAAHRVVLHTF